MPKQAKIYISAIIMLATGVLAASMAMGWHDQDAGKYAIYVLLACLVSTWKVKLPGMHGTMSMNFLFILLGVADLTLPETLVMGLLATFVQCVWKTRRRPKAIQLLFNESAMALSIFASHQAPAVLTSRPYQPVYLALAATVFFFVNTGTVSMVLALVEKRQFGQIWSHCHLWTFPYYLAGAAMAGLISSASRTVGWRPALLPLLLMYLCYCYYRTFVSQRTAAQAVAG